MAGVAGGVADPAEVRGGPLGRLPVRVRLTLAFTTVMVVVLAVSGAAIYESFRTKLDHTIDLDVSTQATSILARVATSSHKLSDAITTPLVNGHENFVQILDRDGRILAATPGLRSEALLQGDKLSTALERSTKVTRGGSQALPQGSRLLTTPVSIHGHPAVLIVGTSLDQQSSSLTHLAVELAIVGPIALLIAVLAGYRLTAATLHPVELMRGRAAAVTASAPGNRLPLPRADDEIRRLGTTLNEMLARLEDSFAHERAFVANASHELRTPLATLRAELELALRRPRPAAELRDALLSVQTEVERLTALADDLLVLARADEGRLPVRPERLAVPVLLATVRDRFATYAERVAIDAPAELTITADPQRLEQALANLLDNALRYSEGRIGLRAKAVSGFGVELHVEDGGPGFPPEFLDQAFDRFSRADPGRAGRGAGLGLSIVRAIARGHGGEAYAANRLVGGGDAWIVIPESPDASPDPLVR